VQLFACTKMMQQYEGSVRSEKTLERNDARPAMVRVFHLNPEVGYGTVR
jgi:hypothetical protein